MSDGEDDRTRAFLYREARLMDEHRYDEWLSLWAPDCLYWIPSSQEQSESDRTASIVFDRRQRLEDRIARLKSGEVLALDPRPAMRRVLSNIEIAEASDSNVTTLSNFVLVYARYDEQIIWCGQSTHTLNRVGDAFQIAKKKVVLVNCEHAMPSLQFLI